ncbi:glutaredoxin [Aphelenchoides avenae]|nr:glutaredoxin [Aphelenchus avenae]
MFSKSYCPYCKRAKEALRSFEFHSKAFEVVELDQRQDGDAILDYLAEKTGARTVPRVFIGGRFFGGGDDTVAAKVNGVLENKLFEAGAIHAEPVRHPEM